MLHNVIAFLMLFVSIPALAVDVPWQNATTNNDGSPLTDLVETRIYYALCTEGVTKSSPYSFVGPLIETVSIDVPNGQWCFRGSYYSSYSY